jgi:tripeptide aminopeptidase
MKDHPAPTAERSRWESVTASLLQLPEVCQAFERLDAIVEDVAAAVKAISEVPAPPFREGERARFVAARMEAAGLVGVHVDEGPSPIGFLPAAGGGRGDALLVAAHIDTVFPPDTDVTVVREGNVMRGPGIGDNASNVGAMIAVAQVLREMNFALPREVIFAGTAGEEGLGDLRGMKGIMRAHRDRIRHCLCVDGAVGSIVHAGVGSRRYEITALGPGGHSYGAFGVPSAIHTLGRMIAALAAVTVPATPKTTFNVGVIRGGTSVNTIAAEASMLLDLRSECGDELARLDAEVMRRMAEVAAADGIRHEVKLVGDRPAAALPADHGLVRLVTAANLALGITPDPHASSTDANVPISLGIPAVTLGTSRKGNTHRVDDYIEVDSLALGMKHLLLCVLLAVGYKG